MLEDLAKGDCLGDYQPLISGATYLLARARVHAQPGGKRLRYHIFIGTLICVAPTIGTNRQ